MRCTYRVGAICTLFSILFFPRAAAAEIKLRYNRDIRPIFAENCFACHGPDKNKRATDMRLDIKELALGKLKEGGFAIVPGDVKQSTLLTRV